MSSDGLPKPLLSVTGGVMVMALAVLGMGIAGYMRGCPGFFTATDPDGVLHYRGSPTVHMPSGPRWFFRLDPGESVETFFQEFTPGAATPFIKAFSDKSYFYVHCQSCTDEELDFNNPATRFARWECDPEPESGNCEASHALRGKRLVFERKASVSVQVARLP